MGNWNFRWFADSRTDVVRPAKTERDRADQALHEYGEHYHETHPRDRTSTPEYYRLNRIAWDAQLRLRKVRGW